MREPGGPGRAPRAVGARTAAALLASVLFQVLIYAWPGQSSRISGLVLFLGIGWAASVHVRAAWRSRGFARRIWLAGAVGMVLWFIAQSFFVTVEVGANRPVGGPSPGDIPNLLSFVFAVLGMLLFPSAPRTASGRIRMTLDGLLITSSLFGVAWLLVLGDLVQGEHDSYSPMRLAYPCVIIVVLSIALLLMAGGGKRIASALTAFCAGIAAAAISALASLFLMLRDHPLSDTGADGALLLAVLFFGWAPGLPLPDANGRKWEPSTLFGQALPYVPVGLVVVVTSTRYALDGRLDPPVFWSALVLVGSVLARQFLTLRINVALTAELEKQRARLAHQATHDPLTGLANRALLADRVGSALAGRRAGPDRAALLLIDLDGFKPINDLFGHAAGDQVLVAVADRLRGCARGGDTVARLGGDEFAVLLTGVSRAADAADVAARLLAALTAPVPIGERELTVGASIGVALAHDGHRDDPDRLLRDADVAMYAAKSAGKGGYRMAEPGPVSRPVPAPA